jgi:hypothetical protein
MDRDKEKSLELGWTVKEEIGICVINSSLWKILPEFHQEYGYSFPEEFIPYIIDEEEEFIPFYTEEGS